MQLPDFMKKPINHCNAIDFLRIFSAFAIVWYHLNAYGSDFFYCGIICFLEIAAYFIYVKLPSNNFILKRVDRLLLPWLFWSVIYGFLNVFKGDHFWGKSRTVIDFVFTGTYIHLWYLPFLFVCSIALIPFIPVLKKHSKSISFQICFIISSALLLFISFQLRASFPIAEPWAEWVHAIPAIFIGIAISQINNAEFKSIKKLLLSSCLLLAVATISIYIISNKQYSLGIPYLVGTVLTLTCFNIKIKSILFVRRLSDLTMGVYLIHLLVLSFVHKFIGAIVYPGIIAVIGFILSISIIFMLKNIRIPIFSKVIEKVI